MTVSVVPMQLKWYGQNQWMNNQRKPKMSGNGYEMKEGGRGAQGDRGMLIYKSYGKLRVTKL